MMTQTIERLTPAEVDLARDYVRAHLNTLLADAVENRARPLTIHRLEAECADWLYALELTDARAAEVLTTVAGAEEERVVAAFLASLAEREDAR